MNDAEEFLLKHHAGMDEAEMAAMAELLNEPFPPPMPAGLGSFAPTVEVHHEKPNADDDQH